MKYFFLFLFIMACGSQKNEQTVIQNNASYSYLALGDSYTKGESVCSTCNFPSKLTQRLNQENKKSINNKIIAETGWTTSDLLAAIAEEKITNDYEIVTLLIGVNNQFQGKSFQLYQDEFPKLLDIAISAAKGRPENVLVLSIPDYAYTPYGKNSGKAAQISKEINKYNEFAEKISREKNVSFFDITSITRMGLKNPDLVASDELHPSETAYELFVDKIKASAQEILD